MLLKYFWILTQDQSRMEKKKTSIIFKINTDIMPGKCAKTVYTSSGSFVIKTCGSKKT